MSTLTNESRWNEPLSASSRNSAPYHSCHQRRKSKWAPLLLATAAVAMNISTVDAFSTSRITAIPSSLSFQRSEPLFAQGNVKRKIAVATEERNLSIQAAPQRNESRERIVSQRTLYEVDNFTGRPPLQHRTMNEANPESLPTKENRFRMTEKIDRMLNDQIVFEETSSQEIADRATVFAHLSDEDKSAATFAVSSDHSLFHIDSEPVRIKNSAKKGKLTANVMETGRDTMKQYVKSMANHQVLSPEDEAVLGRHIQALVTWEEQRQELEYTLSRPPTFLEWADSLNITVPVLKTQIRQSHKAKAAMIEANLRLVISVARQTVKTGRSEINFQDACQEGILGLSRACEKFDPSKGFRFSTYATWWIKKMVHKNLSEQSRPVRLPQSVMKKVNDIRISEKILMGELGRRPSDDEIANKVGITVEQLDFFRRAVRSVESLDKKIKFNKGGSSENDPDLHSVVQDSGFSPTELMNVQFLRDDVRRLINTLSPREQAVIRLRFGLDGGSPKSIEEIATKFKTVTEQVRKIESNALRKLRQPYRNESLKGYIIDIDK